MRRSWLLSTMLLLQTPALAEPATRPTAPDAWPTVLPAFALHAWSAVPRAVAALPALLYRSDAGERAVAPPHLPSSAMALDLYPAGGNLRLSLGARQIGAGVAETAGGAPFLPLAGEDRVRHYATSMTVGFGQRVRRGLSLGLDGGAMVRGLINLGSADGAASLLDQRRASLDAALSRLRVGPMAQLSLAYRF